MAIGILFGVLLTILLNGFATDVVRRSGHLDQQQQRNYLLCIWLIPLAGAVYALMRSNQPFFEDQVVNESTQKDNYQAWNLNQLNEGSGIVSGDMADGDGE